jgi:hypothetical protein
LFASRRHFGRLIATFATIGRHARSAAHRISPPLIEFADLSVKSDLSFTLTVKS